LGFSRYLQHRARYCRRRKSSSADTNAWAESNLNPISQPDGNRYTYTYTIAESNCDRYANTRTKPDGYKYT
jgi:hypothetical protein